MLKPKILSPRNIFIVNLAGSDLLLCVFTMPFSFIELSMKMWQMGECLGRTRVRTGAQLGAPPMFRLALWRSQAPV